MSIATIITASLESNNGKFLALSSVWDVHNTVIGANKNSNVSNTVARLFKENKKVKTIWAGIGRKGRSQHSETEVLLFDVSKMSEADMENANITHRGTFFNR